MKLYVKLIVTFTSSDDEVEEAVESIFFRSLKHKYFERIKTPSSRCVSIHQKIYKLNFHSNVRT